MNNEESHELTEQQENPVLDLNQNKLLTDEEMDQLEKKIEQQYMIKQMALKVTRPWHWLIYGDKAYLERDGINALCSFLGVGLRVGEPVKTWEEDEEGRYYVFTTKCTATFRGVEFEDHGTATSRDPFFVGSGDNKKPQSEVSLGSVKKKSITNSQHRALTGRLGLDFTVEEVEKALGTSLDKSRAVGFKSGNKPKDPLTKADIDLKAQLKKKIWSICDEDPERAKEYIRELTAFNDFKGHESFDRVSMKQLKFQLKRINDDYKKWQAENE